MRWATLLACVWLAACASPMTQAARDGDINKIDALLKNGAPINAHDANAWPCDTPLYAAAYSGQLDAIKDLLKRGADLGPETVAWKVANALGCAELGNQQAAVKLLLDSGAKPDANIMDVARGHKFGINSAVRDLLERAYALQTAPVAAPPSEPIDASGEDAPPRPPVPDSPPRPADKQWWQQ